jgi:DNA repair photolyase
MTIRITPKRRRRFLNPKNLGAWAGAFIRRESESAPILLDSIIHRYLADTKAGLLAAEPASMSSLRLGMMEAMKEVWDIRTGDDDMVQNAQVLEFMHRGGKAWFTIPSGTVLNTSSGFIHKDLCEAGTITAGSACLYSCTYCSVGASMFRSPQTRLLRLLGIEHGDAFLRRFDPVATLLAQLTYKDGTPRYPDPDDHRVAIISPIVDPLASEDLLEETLNLIRIVFELTHWDVRVLTKSMLVKKLADRIPPECRHRMIYGLSIGILDDPMATAVEKMTSAPSRRLEAYHQLRQQGLRTYSMHCPILPQADYTAYAQRLASMTNWETDEHVWAEALNQRGESNIKTLAALKAAGFHEEANLLMKATESQAAWEFSYNRPLFEALAAVCPPGKLRYLVYAADQDRDYWLGRRDRGAVVLGKEHPLDDSEDE